MDVNMGVHMSENIGVNMGVNISKNMGVKQGIHVVEKKLVVNVVNKVGYMDVNMVVHMVVHTIWCTWV